MDIDTGTRRLISVIAREPSSNLGHRSCFNLYFRHFLLNILLLNIHWGTIRDLNGGTYMLLAIVKIGNNRHFVPNPNIISQTLVLIFG